ncbi:AraC family transcriptional regulator [Paenibacillus sp. J5C_2022]|uniref:helix-turn-helix domain-containing protein n=1 Tax=Paenibacillus sp. J5C2022 TaxID=2977129 RepID=UPI0021D3E21C|nr:AraC family transcriptional regulator [Paenibacillus sp. J5C2022]MCU6709120.1 AraC family transcriptional regulator [Paenibacillus sp. J5C2022]
MSSFKENYIQAWSADSERIIATPSAFAKKTLFFIQEIGNFRTHPPYFTEREQLTSFLLVFTVSGAGKLTYNGETYSLRSRQLFLIDCMEYHRYWTVPGESWDLLWVHFNGQSARGYFELYDEAAGPILDLAPDSQIPLLIKQMIQLQKQRSVVHELLISKLLVELLTICILDHRHAQAIALEPPIYIQGLMQEITTRYASKLTLDDFAKQFSISKYHLAKEFKRHTGFTPNEYVINIRITKAKELLKYTDRSVADIAAEVGIHNVSHFINLFKHREGSTPLVYRKQWRPE